MAQPMMIRVNSLCSMRMTSLPVSSSYPILFILFILSSLPLLLVVSDFYTRCSFHLPRRNSVALHRASTENEIGMAMNTPIGPR